MKRTSVLRQLLPTSIGAEFEKSAESHLRKQGLQTICRNYRCRFGEIDLIMADGEFIVFVEVRYRRNNSYGNPLESITASKKKRIIRTATHFLHSKRGLEDRPCRFDAVGISCADQNIMFDWIKNAFST
jgi:putative endonuclease